MISQTVKDLVLEVCYRAIQRIGPEHGVTLVDSAATIAEALAEKICEFSATATANRDAVYEFTAVDVDTFELFHDLLDEIEKTLPIAGRMNVTVTMSRINLKGMPRYAAATTHRGDRGDAEDVDA